MHLGSDERRANSSTELHCDVQLFGEMKAGKIEALGILYDRYASLVYKLALRILTNPTDAEDLTQEVFLILWRGDNYNPSRGSLGSFLTTLTRSRAIDKLRSSSSNSRFLQRWSQIAIAEPSPSTPFELASLAQRSEYVRKALAQLPEQQRQALAMAYYEDLSQSEIASLLGIPLGTIKSRSRQGLLNLRKKLKDVLE